MAEHLAGCPSCRRELEEIRLGIRLAEAIPVCEAPPTLWPAVRRALDAGAGAAASPTGRGGWRWGYALPVLLLAAILARYAARGPELSARPADPEPLGIETAALAEHEHRIRDGEAWEIRSDDVPVVRRWVEETTGLSASIAIDRPDGDGGRLRLVGARAVRVGRARAAVIGYEVDSHPVTLVTARLSELGDPPREARFGKEVTFRAIPSREVKVLAWGSDGQAYAMVSDLPGYGQAGCFLCHTSPERRRLIQRMRVPAN